MSKFELTVQYAQARLNGEAIDEYMAKFREILEKRERERYIAG